MRGVAVVVWCCVKEALSRAAMVRASRGAEAADGGGGAATAPRAPSGSWLELRLPFGADGKLADAFRVFRTDAVRVGPCMEVMDCLAGDVAVRHIGDPGAHVVTAAVDEIEWNAAAVPTVRDDLILRGAVCRAGRTSMDVLLEVQAVSQGEGGTEGVRRRVGGARFVFVRRAPGPGGEVAGGRGGKSAPVPPLRAASESDAALMARGRALWERARDCGAQGRDSVPKADEIAFVHETSACAEERRRSGGGEAAVGFVDIEDTATESVQVIHGQDRNLGGQLFGGWLMRKSYELAWTCGHLHALAPPSLRTVDEITFKCPVPIGSILRMDACVSYVEHELMAVAVRAEVIDPSTRRAAVTNEFLYTLDAGGGASSPPMRVSPRRYANVSRFLEGRRAVARALESRHV